VQEALDVLPAEVGADTRDVAGEVLSAEKVDELLACGVLYADES